VKRKHQKIYSVMYAWWVACPGSGMGLFIIVFEDDANVLGALVERMADAWDDANVELFIVRDGAAPVMFTQDKEGEQ